MADGTKIEWSDATWNVVTGCSVVSPGCTNCYAMKLAGTRMRNVPSRINLTRQTKAGPVWTGEVRFNEEWLDQPLRWKRGRMIFVVAHGDLFHEDVPDEWIDRVFAVMALAPQHRFQVLTKRAKRMREYFSGCDESRCFVGDDWTTAWPRRESVREAMRDIGRAGFRDRLGKVHKLPLLNVWLGVSAEDQERADERIPELLATPAAVRFVSLEPLLGAIDLEAMPFPDGDRRHRWSALTGQALMYGSGVNGNPDMTIRVDKPIRNKLDWLIVGGESGPHARPMHPDWARSLRDQCAAAGVPYFFKQWGQWAPRQTEDYKPDDIALDVRGTAAGHIRSLGEMQGPAGMSRVGKRAAGRLLDGVEHNGMPT